MFQIDSSQATGLSGLWNGPRLSRSSSVIRFAFELSDQGFLRVGLVDPGGGRAGRMGCGRTARGCARTGDLLIAAIGGLAPARAADSFNALSLSPGFVHASALARISSLYFAVNFQRLACSTNSGSGTPAAAARPPAPNPARLRLAGLRGRRQQPQPQLQLYSCWTPTSLAFSVLAVKVNDPGW